MIAARAPLPGVNFRNLIFWRKEFLKPGRCAVREPSVNPAQPHRISTPMPDDLAQPPLGKHGGKRPGAGRPRKGEKREKKQGDGVTSKPQRGHSVAYICARLERDGFDRLLEGVRTFKISAYAAGEAAGYFERPPPRGTGSQNQARKRAWDIRAMIL